MSDSPPALRRLRWPHAWRPLLIALAIGGAAFALQWSLRPWLGHRVPFVCFLPALVLASVLGGRIAGLLVLALGTLSAALWLPPELEIGVAALADQVSIGLFVAFGGLLCVFGAHLRAVRERATAAEARLVTAIEGTGIGVFEIDLEAGTGYVSPALARLLDLPASAQALPLAAWIARARPDLVAESRRQLVELLRAGARNDERELTLARPDGTPLVLLMRVHLAWSGQRAVKLRGACIDITERRVVDNQLAATRAELSQQLDDLQHLHELSSRLPEAGTLQRQLQLILQTLGHVHGTTRGIVWLLDADGARLHLEASMGLDEPSRQRLASVPLGAGASGRAVQQARRVVVPDTELDPGFADWRDTARAAGFRAVHSTPMFNHQGAVLGALSVHFDAPREPTERECALADICARKAAVFVERARAQAALAETQARFRAVLEADIVERKRNEALLREADRRKDEFLATLAHELRNPLAPIRQAARVAATPGIGEERRQWSLGVIERQVQHMALLLDDLLDVSRITRGVLTLRTSPTRLSQVVASAVETARPLLDERGHRLELRLPDEDVAFDADPLRVAQVLANLLTNAAKYTPPGGHVRLLARRDGDTVEVAVADDGIGIAPESLPAIFRMFGQLEGAASGGTGLGIGLALSKGLVELHGGRLTAASEGRGRGSTFTVRLPIAPPAAVPAGAAPPGAAAQAAPGLVDADAASAAAAAAAGERDPAAPAPPAASAPRPRRVLIADDNRDAADTLAALLQLEGHDTRLAFDGEQALEAYAEYRPEVCLFDIGMPGKSGYELARCIRARADDGGRRPLLVAITGWGQESDRQRALDAGFDRHLTKPVDPQRLAQIVADG